MNKKKKRRPIVRKTLIKKVSQEANDLIEFIVNIRNHPEWRDVSLTELNERLSDMLHIFDSKISTELERTQYNLLYAMYGLLISLYQIDFGHPPYNMVEPKRLKNIMRVNEHRLRPASNA